MSMTEKLRVEHGEITRLAVLLAALASPANRQPTPAAIAKAALAAKLLAHLAAEDMVLYPRLLSCNNRQAAVMAERFVAEVGWLAAGFKRYLARWPLPAIQADWALFCSETETMLTAIRNRIQRENTLLYPVADKLVA